MEKKITGRLKVFISYSWESDKAHQDWILKLANDLGHQYGCYVLLDQYDLKAGKGLTAFMERSLAEADKVLVILTPAYKAKAMIQQGGVGFEYSIITGELYDLQGNNDKFIPVLRKGDRMTSAPGYIKTLVYAEMMEDDRYESDLQKLAEIIYDKQAATRPELGPIPDFNNLPKKDPILEEALKKKAKKDAEYKRIAFLNSEEGVDASLQEIHHLFISIEKKAEAYKDATGFYFRVNTNYEELGLRGEGGSGIYMKWSYRCRNSTFDNILLVKCYRRFPFEWSGEHFTSYEPGDVNSSRVEYIFDVDLDLKTYGWRQVDTESMLTSDKLELAHFKWVLDRISEYVDRGINKRRNW